MKTYIKIKIKSLADEAKIIRQEEMKFPGHYKVREGLYLHRVNCVRPECRASNLAYGFLRGRSYSEIEQNPKTKPNWKRVQRIIEKYGVQYFGDTKVKITHDSISCEGLTKLQQAFEVWKYGH